MFKDAFDWDQSNFSLPLHEALTPSHFELDSAARMRNHLAEDVLDKKMLFLMQVGVHVCYINYIRELKHQYYRYYQAVSLLLYYTVTIYT